MADRDDDDRRYGRGYGRDDVYGQHSQGSRWTRGMDEGRSDYGRDYDRGYGDRSGGESWGERLGNRINRFFSDLERDYMPGSGGGRGRRESQAYQDDDGYRRGQGGSGYGSQGDYGQSYGQAGMGRDQTGFGGGQYSQFSRGGGQQGYDRDPGSSQGYGMSGGYASGGAYGSSGMGGSYGQGGFGQGGMSGQGGYGQGGTFGDYGQGSGTQGRGPKGYTRSDSRIEEDVNERLSRGGIDASDIEVKVEGGEVTLSGTVRSRQDRRRAEDLADDVSGVKHVQNNIRVQERNQGSAPSSGSSFGPSSTGDQAGFYDTIGTAGMGTVGQTSASTGLSSSSSTGTGTSYTSSDGDRS